MHRTSFTASLLAAALLALAGSSNAQYLYLDTNGDGAHTAADKLSPSGTTNVTLWLDSNHDRSGSLQTCNSHTAALCGTTASSGTPLDVFSYTIILNAAGGTVSWGSFTPSDPSYGNGGAPAPTSTQVEINYSRSSGVTPAGLFMLGTIPVTVVSGTPTIQIAHGSQPIDPSSFGTLFGTSCEGGVLTGSYLLGDAADPCGSLGDWFDTDGTVPAVANNAPALSAPPTVTAAAGSPTTINASATDPDASDILTISASGAPASLSFSSVPSSSPATASLSGTPTFTEAAGSPYSISWSVNDGAGGTGSANTSLTITRTDTAPTFSAPDTALFAETIEGEFGFGVSDAENDPITSLTASGLPAGANFSTSATNNAGFVVWTPASGQAGIYPVTFTATSGSPALSASKTTIFKVGPPDHRPIVTLSPTSYTINEGQHIHLTPTASDPDGDPLTSFTCKGTQNTQLPPGVTFTTSADFKNGTFDWTPNFAQSSIYHFDLEATSVGSLGEQISAGLNGGGATVVLVINVRNVDRAPTVSAPSTASGTEGVALSIPVSASDPDGDAMTSLTAAPLPSGATFSPGAGNMTGTLSWTPSFTQEGTYSVVFTASNLLSGSATTQITIAHANAPPALSAPASQTVDEGSPLSYTVSAADVDGDHVTLTAQPLPLGAGFHDNGDNTGTLQWTPNFGQAGSYPVTIAGNDGHGGVATATTAITVRNVNRAPVADAGGPYSGFTNVPLTFNGSGSSDPDGDPLTYAWSFGDLATGMGPTPSHTYGAAGTFTVSLTVTDNGSPVLSATVSTTATIASQVAARLFTSGGNSTIRLSSGKPTWCVQVEPIDADFQITDVQIATVSLFYGASHIGPDASKGALGGDKDGNGILEITTCFSKADLRTLLSGVPSGRSTVNLTLEAMLVNGGKITGTIAIDVVSSGGTLAASISPNPFNPQGTLTFTMQHGGSARVRMYDLSGRLVRTLLDDASLSAGYHDVRVDGRDDRGERLSSGVYFYRIETFDGIATGSMTILK